MNTGNGWIGIFRKYRYPFSQIGKMSSNNRKRRREAERRNSDLSLFGEEAGRTIYEAQSHERHRGRNRRSGAPRPTIVLPDVTSRVIAEEWDEAAPEDEVIETTGNSFYGRLPTEAEKKAALARWAHRGGRRERRREPWLGRTVAILLVVMMSGAGVMTVKAWKADHWILSAQNAEEAIDKNRLAQARKYIDEVMEQIDTSAVAFELEARRAARQGDEAMALAAAKAGARYSSHWRSDLMLSRVFAEHGDVQGAAVLAEAAFVRGAPVKYADEIAMRQRHAGRGRVAERVIAYKKQAQSEGWADGK